MNSVVDTTHPWLDQSGQHKIGRVGMAPSDNVLVVPLVVNLDNFGQEIGDYSKGDDSHACAQHSLPGLRTRKRLQERGNHLLVLWGQNPEERKKAASNKDGRRIQKEVMANVLVGVVTEFKVRQK